MGEQKKNDLNPSIKEDPREIREVAEWNRLRQIIYHEAGHPAWGYPLYALHRLHLISNEQRAAGDAYHRAMKDYSRAQMVDVDALAPHKLDAKLLEINETKKVYQEIKDLLGRGRAYLDRMILQHEYPVTEADRRMVKDSLQLLANYFGIKKK